MKKVSADLCGVTFSLASFRSRLFCFALHFLTHTTSTAHQLAQSGTIIVQASLVISYLADVSSASPSSERIIRSDEGLALETSAIVSFTAFHYPYQHTVDTPVCLPPRRRSQPSSLKSWHYTISYLAFSS